MDVYHISMNNNRFRYVLTNEEYIKITVMSLIGRQSEKNYDDDDFEIPWEEHHGSQVLQVFQGSIIVKIDGQPDQILYPRMIAIIPPHTKHYVSNLQYRNKAKILSIYTPSGKMK